jgi:acyl-CoA reductase-like NAD-dependent aldehyde dehydrogenase
MRLTTLFAVLMTLALPACQTLSTATDTEAAVRAQVNRAACAPWRPISTSRRDVLTDQTANEISQHNNVWDALCAPSSPSR